MYHARILTLGALFAVFLASPMPTSQGEFKINNPAKSPIVTYIPTSTISPAGETDMGVNVTVKLEKLGVVHDEESIDVPMQSVDWTVSSGQFDPPAGGWPISNVWYCELWANGTRQKRHTYYVQNP